MNNFAKCLKQHRKKAKITQKSIAQLLNVTEQGYQNYEYGKFEPNIDKLILLADTFNISLDELVGRKFPK